MGCRSSFTIVYNGVQVIFYNSLQWGAGVHWRCQMLSYHALSYHDLLLTNTSHIGNVLQIDDVVQHYGVQVYTDGVR